MTKNAVRMNCGRVVAVVVTHNRPELLMSALNSLRSQSVKLHAIIVVDNASDTETAMFLQNEKDIVLLRIEQNTGGSGGFAAGMEQALNLQPDWIWLIEDDAIVQSKALESLLCGKRDATDDGQKIGLLCPAVEEGGRLAVMHRRYFDPFTLREKPVPTDKYKQPIVAIDTASFVGSLVKAEAVRRIGVPDKRFFLYYDDTEFSLRLKQAGYALFLITESKVSHRRLPASRLRRGPYSLKHYYNLRNRIIVYRKFGHAPVWRWLCPFIEGLMVLIVAGKGKPKAIKMWLKAMCDGRKDPFVVKAKIPGSWN